MATLTLPPFYLHTDEGGTVTPSPAESRLQFCLVSLKARGGPHAQACVRVTVLPYGNTVTFLGLASNLQRRHQGRACAADVGSGDQGRIGREGHDFGVAVGAGSCCGFLLCERKLHLPINQPAGGNAPLSGVPGPLPPQWRLPDPAASST
jgi:hypothetical protein